jgi:hypothetical protein
LVAGAGGAGNAAFDIVGSKLVTARVFDFETRDSFSVRVRVSDGRGGSYAEQFTISVADVAENTDPVARDDTFPTEEDTALVLPDSGAGSPAGNDTDADGDTLTVTDVDKATGGTVAIGGGNVEFVPAADLCGLWCGWV